MPQLYTTLNNQTKKCTKCNKEKPYSGFRKDRIRADGHTYWCKLCLRSYENERNQRPDIREKRLAYYRKWFNKPVNREHRRIYNQQLNRSLKAKTAEKIRGQVRKEIANGNIKPIKECTCVDCGKQAHNYHHDDYGKPLDVEPLCGSCHRLRHTRR